MTDIKVHASINQILICKYVAVLVSIILCILVNVHRAQIGCFIYLRLYPRFPWVFFSYERSSGEESSKGLLSS